MTERIKKQIPGKMLCCMIAFVLTMPALAVELYHPDDKQALRDFLIQQNNYTRVGLTASDIAEWTISEAWIGNLEDVTWNSETPRRITEISWWLKRLTGNLNLSGCAALERLGCGANELSALDVSACTKLEWLACGFNELIALDVSACTMLETLSCNNNQLSALNLSKNTALERLSCENNQLSALDLSKTPALKYLYCNGNRLTALDLSGLSDLEEFEGDNQSVSLTFSKNGSLYELSIPLLNPVFDNKAITYAGGKLQSSDKSATKTGFTVETGRAPFPLSGTMTLVYPGIYHSDDKQALRNFLIQQKNGTYNFENVGLSATDITTWETGEEWVNNLQGVTWNDEMPKRITKIEWSGRDLTGNLNLSGCSALIELYCHRNPLTALDISKNTALEILYCWNNHLTALDISKNTALEYLECDNNQLTALDVSKNTALEYLYCYKNQLVALDVGKNTALIVLNCGVNQLSTLELSKNTELKFLNCDDNQLSALDLDKNTALEWLYCNNNYLTALDLGKNTALIDVECNGNYLTAINLSGLNAPKYFAGEGQTALLTLSVNSGLYELDIPLLNPVFDNKAITYNGGKLQSSNKSVTKTGFKAETNNPKFTISGIMIFNYLGDCYHSDDKQALRNFLIQQKNGTYNFENVGLSATDIATWETGEEWINNLQGVTWNDEMPRRITEIDWGNSNLTGNLNLSGCAALTILRCYVNQLAALDVSQNTALKDLRCYNNPLTALDVGNNTALEYLDCDDNQLSALELSKNTALEYLYCSYNSLTALDVSKNTALKDLICYDNRLTTLDLSKNTALEYLDCSRNQLTVLDLSGLNELIRFTGSNQSVSLTFSRNGNLYELAIPLLNPVFNNAAITYVGGKLQSSSKSVTKTAFTVETGRATSSLSGTMTFTYPVDLYHEDDKQTLRDFLIQQKGGVYNYTQVGLRASDVAEWATSEAWIDNLEDVTWNSETPKRITKIKWSARDLAGNLNLSGCPALEYLDCSVNRLITLDLGKNTALTDLHCYHSQLTALDLNKNTALKYLSCYHNQLSALDISNNTVLEYLDCRENPLTALDLSNNTTLTDLNCFNNQLTALDLSQNTTLKKLSCGGNQLTDLDLSGLKALTVFAGYSQSVSLTLTKNGSLYELAIPLSNPVFDNTAITFVGGILQSNDKSITETGFTVETGRAWSQLSGTMTFTYSDGSGIEETLHTTTPPQIVGYYNIMGQKLPQAPQTGVYIIRYDNGTAEISASRY